MIFKRIVSWIVVCMMLLTGGAAAAADEAEDYAQFFWDGGENVNIQSHYSAEGTGAAAYAVRDGVQVLQMHEDGPYYCYINVSDSLFPKDRPVSVAITVRYFDEGENGEYFSLRYANTSSNFQEPEKVEMTNTGEFKEHTFYIDDFMFANSNNSTDIVLASWTNKYKHSPGPVYIQWLKVERCFPQHPIAATVSSDHIGNIFDGDDEKRLDINLNNVSDTELDVQGEYEILTYDYKSLFDGSTEPVAVEGESSAVVPISAEVSDYGSYILRLKIKCSGMVDGEEKEFENDWEEFRFSVANKKDPEEKSNYMMRSQAHLDYNRSMYILDMMYEMGMSGSREGTSWYRDETVKGTYNPWWMERYFNHAKELGMDGMMVMHSGIELYGGSWNIPVDDEGRRAYANYAAHLVSTYKDEIQYIELWNEPNLQNFNTYMRSPTEYTEMAKEAYTAIKAANPDVKVCVWSTAQIPKGWIEESIEAGILDYSDAVTVHPYDWEDSGMDNRIKNELYVQRITELKQMLADAGHPDMPIILSEIGVRNGPEFASEVGQAAYLTQLFAVSAGEDFIDSIYIYDFMNDAVGDEMGGEGYWGLVFNQGYKSPLAAKLSYIALAGYNKFLADAEPTGKIVRNKTSVYKFKRNADGKDVIILWSDNESESIGLDLGTDEVEIFDMYSNSKGTLSSEDGKYSFEATFEPQYLVGNFPKMEETNAVITVDGGRKYAAANDETTFCFKDSLKRDLTVKARARDRIEIVKNDGMADGVCEITVHTGNDAEKENALEVEFYNGEELVYTTKVHVCITNPLEFSANIEKQSENNRTRYLMNATLTNLKNLSDISGTVSADFSQIGGDIETRTFENVKPGETVSVQLNIPEQIVQRTIVANATVALDYGYTYSEEVSLSKNTAAYAADPPSLTGELDRTEWMGGDWFAADDAYAARYITDWRGTSDCSMEGTAKWDEDNLYLLAIVEDDIFCQDNPIHSMWMGDGLQIAVCDGEERLKTGATFTEIGIAKIDGADKMWRYETQTMYNNATSELKSNMEPETGECSIEKQGGKIIYRARIPWAEIFGAGVQMSENTQLGFSILANDNDGTGRRGWIEYCSGIGETKQPSKYGLMTLVK